MIDLQRLRHLIAFAATQLCRAVGMVDVDVRVSVRQPEERGGPSVVAIEIVEARHYDPSKHPLWRDN